jgi:hypothetical protein
MLGPLFRGSAAQAADQARPGYVDPNDAGFHRLGAWHDECHNMTGTLQQETGNTSARVKQGVVGRD